MRFRPLFLAGLLALAGLSARAQQPTFRSGVDLVRFDIRIADAAGRPITDLRAEEIEILDAGQRLPIVLFQRVTEPAESYVEAAVRAVSAEVSSNEAFPRGHLYILVFDQQHITPGNEQRARLAAEQFIRRRVRPSDRVALYAIPGPGPQIGFTSDKLRAIGELAAIRGSRERTVGSPLGTMTAFEAHRVIQGDDRLTQELLLRMSAEADTTAGGADLLAANPRRAGATDDPAVARRLLQENARTIVNQTDSESRQFLQRLADIVAGLRDIEGRKTVVLFSEGFFQDNLSRELEAVAAAAAQSYSVFYTFDLNPRGAPLTDSATPETTWATEIQSRIAPLSTLAVETDGMMVLDAANRSAAALDAIADQAQEYYLVGFTPSEAARLERGKYRRVTVKVKRPGARVSARTGYTLPPDHTPGDRRRAIDRVLSAPFVQQGLKIDYTTYVTRAESGGHRVVLSLNAHLPLRSQASDTADVVFVARDIRDGRVVASGTDRIPLPGAPAPGSPLGLGSWRVQFNVPPGAYLMRAVVREPGGLIGSADRRIDVRPLDGPDVTVSDLVLGSALSALPVRPRAYTGDGLTGVIEAYGRTAVQLQGLKATLELRRQGATGAAARVEADLQAPEIDENGATARALFRVPLTGIPPGDYLARAVVTARNEIVGERTRQVEVLEGQAPASTEAEPSTVAESISPVEVTRGELAQQYLASLQKLARGTPAASIAGLAAAGRWEEVELELRKPGLAASGFVAAALRGFALFVREDYAGAAGALDEAFTADPTSALTAFFLGWARDGAGDTTAAIGAWRSAAYLDPSLVSAHLALADGYLKLSQRGLAVQALTAGLNALPDSPELQTRLQQLERTRRIR